MECNSRTLWQFEGAPLLSLQLGLLLLLLLPPTPSSLQIHLAPKIVTQHCLLHFLLPLTCSQLTLLPSRCLVRCFSSLLADGWLGWASSHVVSFPGLSGRATAIMNPIKALGLNDGGGLASPAIIGPHRQPARHQQPIIAIKSIRAISLAREPFELTAQGRLDQ